MDKARYLVEAHVVEGRPVSELAATHGVHRSWIYKLLARYRKGGYEALEPRSRAPRSNPNRTPEDVVRSVVSLIRFEAELWQADITHWSLADGQDVEILNMIDDHSRLFLVSVACPTFKAADVADAFRSAFALHGAPASLLCDNGAVFTARPRGGRVLLQLDAVAHHL